MSAVGVVLTTLAACSGVSSTAGVQEETPVAVSGAADVAQVQPAGVQVTMPSQSDPNDALAESKDYLKRCMAQHMAGAAADLSKFAKRRLESAASSRCSSQNSLEQIQAVRARSKAQLARGQKSSFDEPETRRIEEMAVNNLRQQDVALEYLKRGELPEAGVRRGLSKQTAAERRAALERDEAERERKSLSEARYSDCMIDNGVPVASTHEYDDRYVRNKHRQPKSMQVKAERLNATCAALARKVSRVNPSR